MLESLFMSAALALGQTLTLPPPNSPPEATAKSPSDPGLVGAALPASSAPEPVKEGDTPPSGEPGTFPIKVMPAGPLAADPFASDPSPALLPSTLPEVKKAEGMTPQALSTNSPGSVLPADPFTAAAEPPAPAPSTDTKTPIQISAPLLPPPTPPAAAAAAAPAAAPAPRWFLMKELQGTWEGGVLDGNRTQVYGWLQGSYTASTVGDGYHLPLEFNYRANDFLLQQAWVRIARSVVTSGTSEPTFGFQSDWLFGTDYRFTLARGVFNGQLSESDGFPNTYGVDPVQFYGEAYIPTIAHGLDIKVGRFYTPFGVESIEAVSTPFLSHTYTFANAPPFTHMGILATLTLNPKWTFQGGIVAGNDIILGNDSNSPTGIFSVQWTQPSGGRNVDKLTTVIGTADFDQGAALGNYDIIDNVFTHIFNPVLTYNMEAILGYMNNIPDQTNEAGDNIHIGRAYWEGLVNYIAYTFSSRLTAQARFEIFNDPQGVRTSSFNITGGPPSVTDAKGLYEALTLGVVFSPRINKSILIRPEIRYDYNDESAPFAGHHGLATASTDVIIRW